MEGNSWYYSLLLGFADETYKAGTASKPKLNGGLSHFGA